MLQFDTGIFLRSHFETPATLVEWYMVAQVEPPNISAVEKWFQRGRIPGNHLAVLLYLLEESSGQPVSLRRFIRVGG